MLVAAMLAASPLYAAEVAGVRIEERTKADLVLNGAGLRSRLFFKVYVAALYTTKKTTSAAELIDSREPRRIAMHMLRELDADALIGALKDGLRQNHGESELAVLKTDIDQLENIMRSIGSARPGDVIAIDFSTDGTAISFNGQPRGNIAGTAFGRALLKVWLGEKPVDTGLKQALLGG
ncbi:MAG TPA: chalcone isomerase family protein [Rhodocyclaceae bacterium]|nr:chalcone isomerase family protein [Rhodocyclaceae bacterium]